MVASVITEIKSTFVDKVFSYHVPHDLEAKIKVGMRVIIPFGHQKLEGFVVEISSNNNLDYDLKDIIDIIDCEPVLNEELISLGSYISKKWICSKATAYQSMLPKALKAKFKTNINKKYETYIKLTNLEYTPTSKAQKEIIEILTDGKLVSKSSIQSISVSGLKTLISKNVVEEVKKEVYRTVDIIANSDNKHKLTIEQEKVVNMVLKSKNKFSPFLLHGVTGSGKTEVYMHLIEKVLQDKKEALVLVPEISLTPQLVSLFKSRFGSTIAILHSGLSEGEKFDEWRKIVRHEVSIVIGARSAVFAPLTNIGIIIIDEEHSTTYKQDNVPYYSAIDIAIRRAKRYDIPIVLGSATPSVESYTRAKLGIYKLLEMKNRVNKNMPEVYLVDMKSEIKKGNRLFSQILIDKINDRLNKNEQVMILLNRRGYSTVITCSNCGNKEMCPNCDIPLIYHKKENKLKCHYCGFEKINISHCSKCNSRDLTYFGLGTQKLEEELIKKFNVKVVRMDVDTTSKKGSHKKIIEAFMNHEYDILVGTQMIAKGLDFPNVTLVGVINADNGLNIPDFRSAERTYELLSQVAGRSGRANKKGEVIMQGFNMDHYSIIAASKHDYLSFYNKEINVRKLLTYPPFCNLSLIQIKGKDINIVNNEINKIASYLKREVKNISVLGPSPAIIPKINNVYCMQLIIKYKKLEVIHPTFQFLYNQYKNNHKVKLLIDINPNKF